MKRNHDRIPAELPITIDGARAGTTRDLSASGVFFETEGNLEVGARVHFTLQLDNPGGRLLMRGVGEVVRVETARGKTGVGARIVSSRLERADDSAMDLLAPGQQKVSI